MFRIKKRKIKLKGESTVVSVRRTKKGIKIVDERTKKTITTSTTVKEKQLIKDIESGKRKVRFGGRIGYRNFFVDKSDYVRRRKVGRVFLKIKFYKGKQTHTVSADSGFTVPVVSRNERARARDKAFERCVAQLKFYDYSKYEILEEYYLYNVKR